MCVNIENPSVTKIVKVSTKRFPGTDKPYDIVIQQVKNKATQSGKNVNYLVNKRKSMLEK